jgi:hypothetical protein
MTTSVHLKKILVVSLKGIVAKKNCLVANASHKVTLALTMTLTLALAMAPTPTLKVHGIGEGKKIKGTEIWRC